MVTGAIVQGTCNVLSSQQAIVAAEFGSTRARLLEEECLMVHVTCKRLANAVAKCISRVNKVATANCNT